MNDVVSSSLGASSSVWVVKVIFIALQAWVKRQTINEVTVSSSARGSG